MFNQWSHPGALMWLSYPRSLSVLGAAAPLYKAPVGMCLVTWLAVVGWWGADPSPSVWRVRVVLAPC